MMDEWLRSAFLIVEDDEGVDCIRWSNAEGKACICPIAYVMSKFGSLVVPPTATSLKAIDPGDVLGWHMHFDAWVAQEIIQP